MQTKEDAVQKQDNKDAVEKRADSRGEFELGAGVTVMAALFDIYVRPSPLRELAAKHHAHEPSVLQNFGYADIVSR